MTQQNGVVRHKSADDQLVEELASKYAQAVVADPRAGILVACAVAWQGMQGYGSGAPAANRRRQLAEASSRAIALIRFPEDSVAQRRALSIPANRPDGASVSATSIGQRANAYGDVLDADIPITLEAVTAAFTLASIGGSHTPRAEVQRRVREGEDFVDVTKELAARLTKANRDAQRSRAGREAMQSLSALELVARLAELVPDLSAGELDGLADAVESLTDAISFTVESRKTDGPEAPSES
jgi:hypothetical protein